MSAGRLVVVSGALRIRPLKHRNISDWFQQHNNKKSQSFIICWIIDLLSTRKSDTELSATGLRIKLQKDYRLNAQRMHLTCFWRTGTRIPRTY
jgi:hypothetical protein